MRKYTLKRKTVKTTQTQIKAYIYAKGIFLFCLFSFKTKNLILKGFKQHLNSEFIKPSKESDFKYLQVI